jgi:signal peptidase I
MSETTQVPDVSTPANTGAGRTAGPVLAWVGMLLILLARSYRAFLVTLVVAATVPMLWSWTSHVVRSGSMEPSLSRGDVVVGKPHPASDPIPVGRVMIFTNPDSESHHGVLVHRVVENLGHGQFTTAGDANRDNDSTKVPTANFIDRAVINVPFVALPAVWLSEHDLAPLIAWLVITMLALYVSSRPPCDPQHRRRARLSKMRRAAEKAGTVVRRAAVPIIGMVTIGTAAIVGVPVAQADAAFTSTTHNAPNTWRVSTTVAKSVVLTDPGDMVRGNVPLTVTLGNVGSLSYSVRVEYSVAGSSNWKTLCTKASAPYTCSWVTTGFANGDYDLRAISTSGSTTFTSEVVADILVDNAAPSVIMQDPGTPLRGTVSLTATASDVNSGVASVVIQRAPSGSSTWTDVCSDTDAPYSCRFDTTAVAGGSYSFRAIGTDVAGNTATSTAVTNRVVDNTVSSVSLDDPGAYLTGSVSVLASASSTAGVTSVRIQRAPAGTTTWTDVCTDTSSPYSCTWNTALVADGLYDLRAVLLDGAGKTTNSATIANRRVDNSPLRAYDVQTFNGGSTPGKLEPGDSMKFTYSEGATTASIMSGWNGSATAVTLRLRDGGLLGLGSTGDTVDILRNGTVINLGSVNLRQDYIKGNQTAQFAATATASTTLVNGTPATTVTIVVGTQTSGKAVRNVSNTSTMLWTPSVLVTDLNGKAGSATPASELGVLDREF